MGTSRFTRIAGRCTALACPCSAVTVSSFVNSDRRLRVQHDLSDHRTRLQQTMRLGRLRHRQARADARPDLALCEQVDEAEHQSTPPLRMTIVSMDVEAPERRAFR